MHLSIHKLMPVPLGSRLKNGTSGIWLQDIEWAQGDAVFIQAPSGTGKTTLMHLLYGIRKDKEGRIEWDRKEIEEYNREELALLRNRDISIIFQDMRLFPQLTAWENVEIKRTMHHAVNADVVKDWVQSLGMSDKMNSLVHQLSYGEQQRIAILRALLQPFKWLLMDEPFSHLDQANIDNAIALISRVVAQNKAGLIFADLEDNNYFHYTEKKML